MGLRDPGRSPEGRTTEIVCKENQLHRAEPIPEGFVGVRGELLPPGTRTRKSSLSANSLRLVIWTMGLNLRSFDLVWSDECLRGRGKVCTYPSLNCKLLFVQITLHSRLYTKNLKSTELGGPRGTHQRLVGTRTPTGSVRRALQNEERLLLSRALEGGF